MTRYEKLRTKANICRYAASLVEGRMREIWLDKANKLEEMAGNLPVVEL